MSKPLTSIGISVFDADGRGGIATATLVSTVPVTGASKGSTAISPGDSGVVVDGGSGTYSVAFHGTITAINNLFTGKSTGTVIFTSATTGPVEFTFRVTDEDGLASSIVFQGTIGTFTAPVVTMPTAGSLTADAGISFTLEALAGWDITDADDASEYAAMTITITDGALIAVPGTSGATVTDGIFGGVQYLNSSDKIRLVGTIASLREFLVSTGNSTLRYTATSTGNKTLSVIVTDADDQASATGSKTIAVAAAPVVDAPDSFLGGLTGVPDTNIHNSAVATRFFITDLDAGGIGMTMHITTDKGKVTVVAGTSGATVTGGSGSGTDATSADVTITGNLAQLNNLLTLNLGTGGTGTIVYNQSAPGTYRLTVTITDDGTGRTGTNFVTLVIAATVTWKGYAAGTPLPTTAAITNFVVPIDLSKLPAAWWNQVSADGREIRVALETDALVALPRDLLSFVKLTGAGTGSLFVKVPNTTPAPALRIWCGATAATAPLPGDPKGQHLTYDSASVRAWWPGNDDGTGKLDDRTSYGNDATGFNSPTFGGATSDFGVATSYLTNKYAVASGTVGSLPETLVAFVKPSDRSHSTALCSTRGTIANVAQIDSSKATAKTILSDATTGAQTNSKVATAVGDMSKGSWQLLSAHFISDSSRKAYRDGGNVGADTNTLPGTGATSFYSIGATVKNKSVGTVVEKNFDGDISLAFILGTGIPDASIASWLDNYKDAFNQAAYFPAGWSYVTLDQAGIA